MRVFARTPTVSFLLATLAVPAWGGLSAQQGPSYGADSITVVGQAPTDLTGLTEGPEVEGFISVSPPENLYDFSFLAPCPSSGLIIHGDKDAVVPAKDVQGLVEKLKTQKGIIIDQKIVPGANHFFDIKIEPLMQNITGYLDKRLKTERKPAA